MCVSLNLYLCECVCVCVLFGHWPEQRKTVSLSILTGLGTWLTRPIDSHFDRLVVGGNVWGIR